LSPWQTTRFFGFEPFRRILVGNLRETPSEATTTHVCQRVTLQWHVRRFAHRRGILRDETLRSAGDWRRYGGGSCRRGPRVQVVVLQ
jgi:hypothetical protein